ncbi:hypothetical protein LTR94_022819 [Friedmanniomyces endolithicus]|nr:hypothetical protein LTR94_022819 [Friedmanniomyces endolithicus]
MSACGGLLRTGSIKEFPAERIEAEKPGNGGVAEGDQDAEATTGKGKGRQGQHGVLNTSLPFRTPTELVQPKPPVPLSNPSSTAALSRLIILRHHIPHRRPVLRPRQPDVPGLDDLAAAAAGDARGQGGAAGRVDHVDAAVGLAIDVFGAPAVQGHQNPVQILALGRQHIFVARGPFGIGARLQHPVLDQAF